MPFLNTPPEGGLDLGGGRRSQSSVIFGQQVLKDLPTLRVRTTKKYRNIGTREMTLSYDFYPVDLSRPTFVVLYITTIS